MKLILPGMLNFLQAGLCFDLFSNRIGAAKNIKGKLFVLVLVGWILPLKPVFSHFSISDQQGPPRPKGLESSSIHNVNLDPSDHLRRPFMEGGGEGNGAKDSTREVHLL